jgi:vacuolar-type H+-ATPase subunit H
MRAQDQAEEERQSLLAETQAEVERILVEDPCSGAPNAFAALDEFMRCC